MAYRSDRRTSLNSSEDSPNSRLFIINDKSLTEKDFRDAFQDFGDIEELWLVKDKQTGDNKGVTYIKYSKTTSAAAALEAMNGKCIGGLNRSLKIMVASSKDQGSKRDLNEEERLQRLFIIVPKNMNEQELREYFNQFGRIEYANIVYDRNTGDSKGVGYVKYHKFSEAAKAFEECDQKYRAVFAEPRKPNAKQNDDNKFNFNSNRFDSNTTMTMSKSPLLPSFDLPAGEGYTALSVITSPMVTEDHLWRLFDIVPGMEYCQLRVDRRRGSGLAKVVYSDPRYASHARLKLHGFEYPPGNRLIIKPDFTISPPPSTSVGLSQRVPEKRTSEIMQLAETIAQASSLIQAAGLTKDLRSQIRLEEPLCSVKLPDQLPMAHIDSDVAARCFIVCSPPTPPNSALKDVFCRFGDLIDVYMLNNRNCGYAKYASAGAAASAIKVLHGAEVCGSKLKVIEAEEERSKRIKLE